MKYVSLDLETTCVEEKSFRNIIGLSMIVEDTMVRGIPTGQLPHFTCLIDQGWWSGNAYALQMNARFLRMIATKTGPYQVLCPNDARQYASDFLDEHFPDAKYGIVLAGKNVAGFDYQFLPTSLQKKFNFRMIDVGNHFIDWHNDDMVPGMAQCMSRSGITPNVTHDMYMDAQDNIACLRATYPDIAARASESDE